MVLEKCVSVTGYTGSFVCPGREMDLIVCFVLLTIQPPQVFQKRIKIFFLTVYNTVYRKLPLSHTLICWRKYRQPLDCQCRPNAWLSVALLLLCQFFQNNVASNTNFLNGLYPAAFEMSGLKENSSNSLVAYHSSQALLRLLLDAKPAGGIIGFFYTCQRGWQMKVVKEHRATNET